MPDVNINIFMGVFNLYMVLMIVFCKQYYYYVPLGNLIIKVIYNIDFITVNVSMSATAKIIYGICI